jgi:hypothetical protein
MQDGKKLIRGTLCLISLIGIVNIAQAEKSVFIISKHSIPSQAQAYRIDGDQITYQAQVLTIQVLALSVMLSGLRKS